MLTGVRVLLVNTLTDEADLYEIGLGHYGARVRAVASALDAIEALAGEPFDVLVSDIDVDQYWGGYALVRTIRGLPDHHVRTLPAVALTGWAGEEDRARAADAGFQRHCAKPCPPSELAEAIAGLLGRAVPV
jgi:CheY-like chemotaxis protein